MRVLIVDDEAPARRKLRRFVDAVPGWQVTAEARSVATAVDAVRQSAADLVLLDIQLGDGTGFDVVERCGIEQMPRVVFVTAYDEFALKAFDVAAQDYLLKPVSRERFERMVRRVEKPDDALASRLESLLSSVNKPAFETRLVVQSQGERSHFVRAQDIVALVADRNYIEVETRTSTYRLRGTLSELLGRLDPSMFAQANRSTVINLDQVREIQPWFRGQRLLIMASGREVKLSRQFAQAHEALKGAL